MWNTKAYIWDEVCLKNSLLMVIGFHRQDLLDSIMKSKTMISIFRSLSLSHRDRFIQFFIQDVFPVIKDRERNDICERVFRNNLVNIYDYQSSAMRYYASNMYFDTRQDLKTLAKMFA